MIEINNFSLFIDGKKILNNLNLTLKTKQKIALLGQSGSGKSLLARAILGLLPQNATTSGEIQSNQKFGVILQNPASCFDGIFSLKEHFLETLKAHHLESLSSDKWGLEEVGLKKEILDSYPFELSGGMLQRAMIALSICIKPDFIIADEMTSDLDCLGVWQISNLLLNLQNKMGFEMLFITHDLFLAYKMAEEIIILNQGEIIEQGNRDEIFKTPKPLKPKNCYLKMRDC